MGKQEGDAYPDPRKMHSGRCKTKVVVCIGLVLICLVSSITAVSAPGDDLPDPRMASVPILGGYHDGMLLVGIPIVENQTVFAT